jgi:enoyl-CoA hydratase/carnithine racemase
MSDSELVELRTEGRVALVTLDDEEHRNALTIPLGQRLLRVCEEISANEDIRAVVVTGRGSAFSAGGDIHRMSRGGSVRTPDQMAAEHLDSSYTSTARATIKAFVRLESPIIVAMNGPALGWGFDIALAGDIRVASRTAQMGESFVRLGAVSGTGGIFLLPRIIGLSRAAELLFTGRTIDADEALRMGAVSYVTDPEEVVPKALELANEVAAAAPIAVRLTKRALSGTANLSGSLDAALTEVMYMNHICLNSEDHREAATAILERRPPDFNKR